MGGFQFALLLATLAILVGATIPAPCIDHSPKCRAMARAGYCRYSPWTQQLYQRTRKSCPYSCSLCVCRNTRYSCGKWAARGHCSKGGGIWARCSQSCGLCGCRDERKYCQGWAKEGWCSKNPNYMLVHCRKSCNSCGCQDLNPKCQSWARLGFCNTSKTFMGIHCRKTCRHCVVKPNPKPTNPEISKRKVNGEWCGKSLVKRVVGGRATIPGRFPWMVGIARAKEPGKIICGASLITANWVLTAAHCFSREGGKSPNNYVLQLGEHHLKKVEGFEVTMHIKRIILHPKFDLRTVDNDIALLQLKTQVEFSKRIAPICLVEAKETFKVGTYCTISGWGALMEDGSGAVELHTAQVPLIAREKCNKAFSVIKQSLSKNMLCAGHVKGGIDTCEGDSGGPLVCLQKSTGVYRQVGIVSWGYGCARKGLYGVYTDLKRYRTWIERVIKRHS